MAFHDRDLADISRTVHGDVPVLDRQIGFQRPRRRLVFYNADDARPHFVRTAWRGVWLQDVLRRMI
jgi:hypothetical protein